MFRHTDFHELQVGSMWREILGTEDFHLHDDFFEVGGDETATTALLSAIRRVFALDPSVEQLTAAPTIARQAARIRAAVRSRGPGPTAYRMYGRVQGEHPLVCTSTRDGDVISFQQIRDVDVGRPVVGLRSAGIDLEDVPLTTIEDMARRHIADLDLIGVPEPFALCGFSHGALVAFEMAGQLERAGRSVAYVGLFEPFPADGTEQVADIPELMNERLEELCAMYEVEYVPDRLDDCLERLKESTGVPAGVSPELFRRRLEVFALNVKALSHYRVEARLTSRTFLYTSRNSEGLDDVTRLDEAVSTRNPYEAFWARHLPPQTVIRRQACEHRLLFGTPTTRTFLGEDVAWALDDHEDRHRRAARGSPSGPSGPFATI
ncbi:thioesterase domain-containing protein [Embleya hyalina]|uniref:Non-ribosomal peptide synthetase n=1 Tax=Embleya hyalina TaxID=516124 RepID=A0A401YEE0_9ACTN|nr:thioesterase domain-containing protein [Embleya hyalina]GCD92953.1 non-ribosomal peptide synthetase [Embleya hyalina]